MDESARLRREVNGVRSQREQQRELSRLLAQQCAMQIAALAQHLEHRESEFARTVHRIRSRRAFRLALLLGRIRRRIRAQRRPTSSILGVLHTDSGPESAALVADEVVRLFQGVPPPLATIGPAGGMVSAVRIAAALVRFNEMALAESMADALLSAYPGVVTPEWTAEFLSELRVRRMIEPAQIFVTAAVRRWPNSASIRFEAAAFTDAVGGVKERITNWQKVLDVATEVDIPTIRTTAEAALDALRKEPEVISWRALDPLDPLQYQAWIRANEDHGLEAFERWRVANDGTTDGPTFAIVMPVFNPPVKFLAEALNSVVNQWYSDWEIIICDDGSRNAWFADEEIGRLLEDRRVRVIFADNNRGISAATNAAIDESVAKWVVFMDQDDLLSPDALAHVSTAIVHNPSARLIYSDEDSIDASGARSMPYFKPQLVRELLVSQNVVNHLCAVRRDVVRQVGGLRSEFDGSQDWDLMLRVFELLGDKEIVHVPHILYHWRKSSGTFSSSEATMATAYLAGLKTVREAIHRRGLQAAVRPVHDGAWFQVSLRPADPAPRVSIIVPTRDHPELIIPCVESVLLETQYEPYELIIMNNGTRDVEALQFLQSVGKRDGVKVVSWDRPFNFSELLNEGVRRAGGDIVVSLNNDVIVHQADWLTQFAAHLQRDDVGAVGARLLYANRRVQHAGVLIGLGGVAGHSYGGAEAHDPGYFGHAVLNREVEAVTAAVMAVRRAVFIAHGGFDEKNLPIAFNDVDFCLRLRKSGLTNIQLATVELTHYESRSRGDDHRPDRREGFAREVDFMRRSWGREGGDLLDGIKNPNFVQRVGDRLLAPAPTPPGLP